ncbi:MAG: ferric uptake regulation protein [Fibrobacteres bacterium]|nr:ferric uptake regulation protein [Fibrobacterota bacterium]
MKRPDATDPAAPFLDRLRQGKVKVTPNRRKVLGRFLEGDKPWTLQSLHRSLSEGEDCDLSSVYRALSALHVAGLLEEFRLPGEKQTFYSLIRHSEPPRTPGTRALSPRSKGQTQSNAHHHHHIVCQDCGKVSHLDICLPAGVMGKVEDASGFRITEHHLEFRGICGKCK